MNAVASAINRAESNIKHRRSKYVGSLYMEASYMGVSYREASYREASYQGKAFSRAAMPPQAWASTPDDSPGSNN
jgi:hypothetical protein